MKRGCLYNEGETWGAKREWEPNGRTALLKAAPFKRCVESAVESKPKTVDVKWNVQPDKGQMSMVLSSVSTNDFRDEARKNTGTRDKRFITIDI